MAKGFIEKVETIREGIKGNVHDSIMTYKKLIPWNEKKFKLIMIKVKNIYKVICLMKCSNSRGNDKLTARILKQMLQFIAITTCHLFNSIIRF